MTKCKNLPGWDIRRGPVFSKETMYCDRCEKWQKFSVSGFCRECQTPMQYYEGDE